MVKTWSSLHIIDITNRHFEWSDFLWLLQYQHQLLWEPIFECHTRKGFIFFFANKNQLTTNMYVLPITFSVAYSISNGRIMSWYSTNSVYLVLIVRNRPLCSEQNCACDCDDMTGSIYMLYMHSILK